MLRDQSNDEPLLWVARLRVEFRLHNGVELRALDDLDLRVHRGEIHGLVGESGSGKTVLALSVLRLIDFPGEMRCSSSSFVRATRAC